MYRFQQLPVTNNLPHICRYTFGAKYYYVEGFREEVATRARFSAEDQSRRRHASYST